MPKSLHPTGKQRKPKWFLRVRVKPNQGWVFYSKENPDEMAPYNVHFLPAIMEEDFKDFGTQKAARNVGGHLIREGYAVGVEIVRDPPLR